MKAFGPSYFRDSASILELRHIRTEAKRHPLLASIITRGHRVSFPCQLQRDRSHKGSFLPRVWENRNYRCSIFFWIKNFPVLLASIMVWTKAIYPLLASVLVRIEAYSAVFFLNKFSVLLWFPHLNLHIFHRTAKPKQNIFSNIHNPKTFKR